MQKLIKKVALSVFFIFQFTFAFTQAKKPTIMVVPSDNWCVKNGFVTKFDEMGITKTVPDYEAALQNSSDLLLVMSKLNELMKDRGFPLINLETSLKSMKGEMAEDALVTSKSGSGISETPYDKVRKTAKADIIMQITWSINQLGPKRSITFNLQGLDAYSNKQVAGASGTGQQSFSTELPVLLEEAVLTHLDNFNSQLQEHFSDLFENGREVTIRIKKFDSWSNDLESEYNGEELSSIIEDWMAKNTVKGRFSTSDATENMMLFEQVRIPLYDTNGKAIDARDFCKGLQKFLKNPPYSIENKLMTKGLGAATIVLGSK
ncbi:MAG: DUF6175 family protein [Chitinophagales bacterium]